jgi:hypothetical protein
MGLYFSRVYDTRRLPEYCPLRVYDTSRSLRCHSRGCDAIKTSGQHPSRGSYIRRRPGLYLYPSRCYDTRRTTAVYSSKVKPGHWENISKKFKKLFFLHISE